MTWISPSASQEDRARLTEFSLRPASRIDCRSSIQNQRRVYRPIFGNTCHKHGVRTHLTVRELSSWRCHQNECMQGSLEVGTSNVSSVSQFHDNTRPNSALFSNHELTTRQWNIRATVAPQCSRLSTSAVEGACSLVSTIVPSRVPILDMTR